MKVSQILGRVCTIMCVCVCGGMHKFYHVLMLLLVYVVVVGISIHINSRLRHELHKNTRVSFHTNIHIYDSLQHTDCAPDDIWYGCERDAYSTQKALFVVLRPETCIYICIYINPINTKHEWNTAYMHFMLILFILACCDSVENSQRPKNNPYTHVSHNTEWPHQIMQL